MSGPWTSIFLDNALVTAEEQHQICPAQTQLLTLRVETNGKIEQRTLTLQVGGTATPPTATPTNALLQGTATPIALLPAETPASTPTIDSAQPTATPTNAPSPEQNRTPAVVQNQPTATPTNALPQETATPTSTPNNTKSGNADNGVDFGQYILFAIILIIVGGAIVYVLARQSHLDDEA